MQYLMKVRRAISAVFDPEWAPRKLMISITNSTSGIKSGTFSSNKSTDGCMRQYSRPSFALIMPFRLFDAKYLGTNTAILSTGPSGTKVNSLAPGRPRCHFKTAIFNLVLLIGIFTSSNDNPLRWVPWDLTDDKSTLVQVMAWHRQATSHYLSQCWPSSMSPYGVTRPQWVNTILTAIQIFSFNEYSS